MNTNHGPSLLGFRSLIALIVLSIIYSTFPQSALAGDESDGSALDPRSLADQLADALIHVAEFDASLERQAWTQLQEFLNAGIQKVDVIRFKSRAPVMVRGSGQTILRFHVTILTYDTAARARTAGEALLASADPNTGLSYAWDRVMAVDRHLVWLSAPCLMSRHVWDRLASQCDKAVSPQWTFNCTCGRSCGTD